MAARREFEKELARLEAVRADPDTAEAQAILARSLVARSNLIVSRAAEIIGEWSLAQFEPQLASAFDRFLIDSARRDPTCAAKFAIVEALNRLEVRDAELFRCGVRHVQMEPVWGGQEDTAPKLRAASALGLARSGPPDVLLELADLLADKEVDARLGAIRAITASGRPGSAPLLWYKAAIGDAEPAVMYDCFAALLALEPERAMSFVHERARGEDIPLAEAALLAMGISRIPEALPLLVSVWEDTREITIRRTALLSIASLRSDEAFQFLLDLYANGPETNSVAALQALDQFRDDERRVRKIERATRKRSARGNAITFGELE